MDVPTNSPGTGAPPPPEANCAQSNADDPDTRIFQLLIEEYKSLREEIGRFQNQEKQLIIAAIAGVGAIGAGFLKENSITDKYADFFCSAHYSLGRSAFCFCRQSVEFFEPATTLALN